MNSRYYKISILNGFYFITVIYLSEAHNQTEKNKFIENYWDKVKYWERAHPRYLKMIKHAMDTGNKSDSFDVPFHKNYIKYYQGKLEEKPIYLSLHQNELK